ncbi:MAG: flagellar basal body rod protein FlgB [Woeseia sp.]|nr:flagellar basal body rod protein FlgB [Woeseia sp.]MBT8097924.1 flagellar basal body rod protein FlgB [Woeseia sp.]NNE60056.1 flagellar basal body rod protein FlgB [Woeseia sp.]NNL55525.1 flagellar basal body rod protein FlgB [Woeseia sp.]
MKIQAFATHEQALKFRALRNEVLSSNIANADTPNYKARDIDFQTALKNATGAQLSLRSTHELHAQPANSFSTGTDVQYRVPTQPTLDGNTVQTDVEQAAFAENAVQYRASLTFLNGSISTLRYALKGSD